MIDADFKIETDQLCFRFVEGTSSRFLIRRKEGLVELVYPPQTDFPSMQRWLFKVICEVLRKQAKLVLPGRLDELSRLHGFDYTRVNINSARTRWGSCSSKKHINLSLFLMALPRKLSDYVLLHELCHTVEMNHGPRFWALMDKVTDEKAKALRAELRQVHLWQKNNGKQMKNEELKNE